MDLFDFFRYVLGTVATIYATIITLQSLWAWYVWLAGQDKYISLVRRYVIVHGLRLRVRAFGGDVLVCLLLTIAFFILWRAHVLIYDLGDKLEALKQSRNSLHELRFDQSNHSAAPTDSAGIAH